MQTTSYRELADSVINFKQLLSGVALEMKSDDWLCRAYDIVEKLANVYTDDIRRRELMKQENGDGGVYFAFHDVNLLHNILPFMGGINEDILKIKLKKILKMGLPSLESLDNSEARNILWELNFFSRLKKANVQVSLGNPNPDILACFGPRKYYIQCKRLYSSQKAALRRNIINAVSQLEKDLSSNDKNAFGILAFSLERPIAGGKLMLVSDSEQIGKDELVSVLQKIISQHGHLWQNPELIRNQRIVAIVLHLIVPGIVQQRNIFVTSSQVIVNNTWADGRGFQQVIDDFGSLKQFLEY